jgi:putative ABC transport system permease protein
MPWPRFSPAAASARWALRAYTASTLLILTAGTLAVAAALPVVSLGGIGGGSPRLHLPSFPDADLGVGWSRLAATPTALQLRGLATLGGILLGLAVAVLAVAGMTVLALSASRASARRSEMVVRRAVGASRVQLRAGGLLEGGAIVAVLAAIAVPLGVAGTRSALAAWPGTVAPGTSAAPVAALLSLAAVILLGALLPMLVVPRTPRRGLGGAHPLGLTVPTVQLAISFAMLLVAAQLTRHAGGLLQAVPAATRSNGQILQLDVRSPRVERAARYASLLRRLGEDGAYDLVSLSSPGALAGLGTVDVVLTDCGRCSQGGIFTPIRPVLAAISAVSPDTFRAMGIPVLSGRGIAVADSSGRPRVAVISRTLAQRHFEQQGAIGRKIHVGQGPDDAWYTVVGIVENRSPAGFGGALAPSYGVYLSALQFAPAAADLLVRPRAAGSGLGSVERAVHASLGTGAVVRRVAEAERVAAEAAPVRWFERLVSLEGVAVLAIAVFGTFAVMQSWVTALLPELAVRRAVGARRRHIFEYVLLRGIAVASCGVALGLWLGEITSDPLASLVAGLPLWDLALVPRPAVALVVAALAGAVIPARRAARADPAGVLATLEM